MTTLDDPHRLLLEVVRDSRAEADTRNIDHEFYWRAWRSGRSSRLDRSLLDVLRDMEALGLTAEVPIPGGTGPGWQLTEAGENALGGTSALPAEEQLDPE